MPSNSEDAFPRNLAWDRYKLPQLVDIYVNIYALMNAEITVNKMCLNYNSTS